MLTHGGGGHLTYINIKKLYIPVIEKFNRLLIIVAHSKVFLNENFAVRFYFF